MKRQDSKKSQVSSSAKEKKPLTPEEKLDQAIEDLGGLGQFQVFAYVAISSGLNACGFWFY